MNTELRLAMDILDKEWKKYIRIYADSPVAFDGPHYGVHIRKWKDSNNLSISVEADPGYVGIGATLYASEARGFAKALLRAASKIEQEISGT